MGGGEEADEERVLKTRYGEPQRERERECQLLL